MKQGNILHIDLTSQTFNVERDEELFERFMGGTAAGTELLFKYGRPKDDPYIPEAPIIFAIGPFNSLYPVATKTVALFKSPQSGELGESHAGGRFSMALREAGIDAMVITGRSERPTYLAIDNHKVAFKSAATFWGSSSTSCERILREAETVNGRKLSIVRIGPAGERRSPLACAVVDSSRHFGRTGLGGVMGSKNLKAVVVSGNGGWEFEKAEMKAYNEVYDVFYDRVVRSKDMAKYHDVGTSINIKPLSMLNGLPTRNFSQGSFESADKVSGETFARDHLAQHIGCVHCQCGCIHMATLREEFQQWHYATSKVSYDYELIYALGTSLSVSSPQDILRMILEVERQGWDVISMGITLAWASEAYVNGVITDKDTGGLALNFGNTESYLEMMRRCAAGEEFFRDLELGCAKCSEKWGGKDFAIHYGGVEPAGYMTGENFTVSSLLGVRHSHLDDLGYSIDQKILTKPMPVEEQVSTQVKEAQWRMILNSLAICLFARGVYDMDIVVKGLNALSLDWTKEKIDELGVNMLRRKNEWRRLCGFDPDKLAIPPKMLRVRSANGRMSEESLRYRMKLYREYSGIG
ncbi:MAG: aldehyde:ferredoxin oxidoreductase [Acidobacteriota bacterium]|jgi:aldehyde:ferredoxin oxidoreductase|nr:aldehyde:ferredoxin oxidoreductase [Acidobacteriota bacterium]